MSILSEKAQCKHFFMKFDLHFFTVRDDQTEWTTFPCFQFRYCEPIEENVVGNKDRK